MRLSPNFSDLINEVLRRDIGPTHSVACGKSIHISSVYVIIPWAKHANYASSKGVIKMLMQTLAQENGHRKIRVNSICPHAIQTSINKDAWDSPKDLVDLLTLIQYNRIGQPEDIGNLEVFLATDFADYITGTSIFIDSGMTSVELFYTGG